MLTPELGHEVGHTLDDLRLVRLPAATWTTVRANLEQLDAAMATGDEAGVRDALLPVSRAAFEGQVHGRLGGSGRSSGVVVATKKTSALPIVGAVCGIFLLGLAWMLGGGLVLAGTAVLAVFVFGVAVAGTRTNAARTEERRTAATPPGEVTERAPADVQHAIDRLRVAIGGGDDAR
jgi:hypothetical protein